MWINCKMVHFKWINLYLYNRVDQKLELASRTAIIESISSLSSTGTFSGRVILPIWYKVAFAARARDAVSPLPRIESDLLVNPTP